MRYRVELAANAEAELEQLYPWVVEQAPHRGPGWFNGLEKRSFRSIVTTTGARSLLKVSIPPIRFECFTTGDGRMSTACSSRSITLTRPFPSPM